MHILMHVHCPGLNRVIIIYLGVSPLIDCVNLEDRDHIVLIYAPPVWLAQSTERRKQEKEGGRKRGGCNGFHLQRSRHKYVIKHTRKLLKKMPVRENACGR